MRSCLPQRTEPSASAADGAEAAASARGSPDCRFMAVGPDEGALKRGTPSTATWKSGVPTDAVRILRSAFQLLALALALALARARALP